MASHEEDHKHDENPTEQAFGAGANAAPGLRPLNPEERATNTDHTQPAQPAQPTHVFAQPSQPARVFTQPPPAGTVFTQSPQAHVFAQPQPARVFSPPRATLGATFAPVAAPVTFAHSIASPIAQHVGVASAVMPMPVPVPFAASPVRTMSPGRIHPGMLDPNASAALSAIPRTSTQIAPVQYENVVVDVEQVPVGYTYEYKGIRKIEPTDPQFNALMGQIQAGQIPVKAGGPDFPVPPIGGVFASGIGAGPVLASPSGLYGSRISPGVARPLGVSPVGLSGSIVASRPLGVSPVGLGTSIVGASPRTVLAPPQIIGGHAPMIHSGFAPHTTIGANLASPFRPGMTQSRVGPNISPSLIRR